MSQFDSFLDRTQTESIKWRLYGPDVIPLWVADMDFQSPECVIHALQERVAHGIFGYPDDLPGLKEAVADWAQKRYQWQFEPDAVILLPGVVVGFNLVCQALTQPGESLIIQPPVYPPFFSAVRNAGLIKKENPLIRDDQGHYCIDFENFEEQCAAGRGVFLLCNPHNPTGRVFTVSELTRLAEICQRYDLIICSDEIHADLLFSGNKHTSIASLNPVLNERCVTLLAPSKTFNIPGLGCSLAVIPDAKLREKIQSSGRGMVGHVNLLGQVAALAAYLDGEVWLDEALLYMQQNRDFLIQFIHTRMKDVKCASPEGTYLAWLDFRLTPAAEDPFQFFLDRAKIALFPGKAFGTGGEGFARLNFACPRSHLEEALERMAAALNAKS